MGATGMTIDITDMLVIAIMLVSIGVFYINASILGLVDGAMATLLYPLGYLTGVILFG